MAFVVVRFLLSHKIPEKIASKAGSIYFGSCFSQVLGHCQLTTELGPVVGQHMTQVTWTRENLPISSFLRKKMEKRAAGTRYS